MNEMGVVRVGSGRGFIAGEKDRFIITAAHCLPHLPPAAAFAPAEDRTYTNLIGPRDGNTEISVECVFVDPVSDIAVLGEVDNQVFLDGESKEYIEFVEASTPFAISNAPLEGSGFLYSLDGHWFSCKVQRQPDGPLWIFEAEQEIAEGCQDLL